MPRKNNVINILRDHEKRIAALEAILTRTSKKSVKQKTNVGKQSLSDHILELRNNSFFSQPKTADETHGKLKVKYHCELDRVAMALLRLSKRKELRKATKINNGKKYKAYVW